MRRVRTWKTSGALFSAIARCGGQAVGSVAAEIEIAFFDAPFFGLAIVASRVTVVGCLARGRVGAALASRADGRRIATAARQLVPAQVVACHAILP